MNGGSLKETKVRIYLTIQPKKQLGCNFFSKINRRACPFIRQVRVCKYMSENFRAEAWTEFEVHKYYIARKKWDWIKIEVKFIASAVCPIFYDSGNCIRISIWLLTSTLFPQNGVSFGFWRNQIFGLKRPRSVVFFFNWQTYHSKWPVPSGLRKVSKRQNLKYVC